jgi:hypothetical protein
MSQPAPTPAATVALPPELAATVAPAAAMIPNGAGIDRNEEFTSANSDSADAHAEHSST